MRARAGDPPRTMPQKILAGRAADPALADALVRVKVDQVILSRAPNLAFNEALAGGLKRTPVEVAVAYDRTCISDARWNQAREEDADAAASGQMLAHGIQLARAGVGFPAAVHLERFASPARLALTDEPRLAALGGIGMYVVLVSSGQLADALATGHAWVRPPRSVQVLLSGRTRPFVCARDIGLELIRRGLREVVAEISKTHGAPVVLEFAGTSARLLNVAERAVLTSIAPHVGAQTGIFLSDEKSETFLRDQRRSKAHRTLFADQGAPFDHALSIDLASVDPLLMDETGEVRPVRDLQDRPISQALLGGDSGVTLRDMVAAASLLKSKRVAKDVEFLVAPPSRQILEVLASTGAMAELTATGARFLEPDHRIMSGALYSPTKWNDSVTVRTCEAGPDSPGHLVCSAETLAYSVANGAIGDPRSFKRPVRVTVPRQLPTDDVLITRERRGDAASKKGRTDFPETGASTKNAPWDGTLDCKVLPNCDGEIGDDGAFAAVVEGPYEERRLLGRLPLIGRGLKAVVGKDLQGETINVLSGRGILALSAPEEKMATCRKAKTLAIPGPSDWGEAIKVKAGKSNVECRWAALEQEQAWTKAGGASPEATEAPAGKKGKKKS